MDNAREIAQGFSEGINGRTEIVATLKTAAPSLLPRWLAAMEAMERETLADGLLRSFLE